MLRTSALHLLLAAALLPAGLRAASADDVTPLDEGRFLVSQHGKVVRVEDFSMDRSADTLVVRAWSFRGAEVKSGDVPDKQSALEVGALDYAFVRYQSEHVMGPDTLRRGVETTPGDTVFTLWREVNDHGTGDRLSMPPGRLYVLDPPLFTTFDYVVRTLQGKTFDKRPITMLVLGSPDSVVEVTVTDAGRETIRWGGRPVTTHKLLVGDTRTTFTTWNALDGRMLKLEQPEAGIVVERKAPPPRHRAPAPGSDRAPQAAPRR